MREPSVGRRPEQGPGTVHALPAGLPALAAVLGLLGAFDAVLLAAAMHGRMSALYGVVVHAALIAIALAGGRRCMSGDRTPWVIGLLLTAVAGPLGAAGGLLIAVLEWRAAQSQSLLEDWYAWMSGTTGVDSAAVAYEAIVTGRSVRTGSVHARRFAEVIRSGALPEKQAVLGLVGLKYHRDYLPVLQLALRSPQASVRAQAAAVFVKLKERFRGELSRLIAARVGIVGAASARGALADARLVLDCCRSGFIDAAEAREALRMAAGWCDEIAAGTELSDAAEMLACELLAAAGDHEALASRVPRDRTGVAGGARVLLAQSLMMLGRTRELHALLANGGVAAPARASSQPA